MCQIHQRLPASANRKVSVCLCALTCVCLLENVLLTELLCMFVIACVCFMGKVPLPEFACVNLYRVCTVCVFNNNGVAGC